MLTFKDARLSAQKKLTTADHMLTQTYPLLKDPKLLLGVWKNITESVKEGILAFLLYEASMKRINKIPETFRAQLTLFQRELVPKYGLPESLMLFIFELEELIAEHKTSPVEFARKNQYVICDGEYNLKKLTPELLKKQLTKAKIFMKYIESKVNRNDAKLT